MLLNFEKSFIFLRCLFIGKFHFKTIDFRKSTLAVWISTNFKKQQKTIVLLIEFKDCFDERPRCFPAPECIYLIAIKWWDQAMKLLQVFKLSTREAKTVCCTRLQRPKSTVCVCFENDNMHMRNWTRSFIPSWCGSRLTKRVLQQQKQQQSAICAE